ncbi:MAG: cation transporter [Phycisphaerales bacterium]|nr:MAG: cation transporter [Phycisphaerales bacterium]
MRCDGCVAAVRGAIVALPGIGNAEVQVGGATVDYDPTTVALAKLLEAIQRAGPFAVESYEVTP